MIDQVLSGVDLPAVLPSTGFLLLAWVVVRGFIKGTIRTEREIDAAHAEAMEWREAYREESRLSAELAGQNSRLLAAADLSAHAFSTLPEAGGDTSASP